MVPTYHGTRQRFEGLPEFQPDAERIGLNDPTHYAALNPRMSKEFAKPSLGGPLHGPIEDPRIIEELVDLSNVGYSPWNYPKGVTPGRSKKDIFPEMRKAGRSGVILDPSEGKFFNRIGERDFDNRIIGRALESGNYLPEKELRRQIKENIDFLGLEHVAPQLVLWDQNTPRVMGNIFRPYRKLPLKDDLKYSTYSEIKRKIKEMLNSPAPLGKEYDNLQATFNSFDWDFQLPNIYTGDK